MNALKRILIKAIYKKLNFKEYSLPKLTNPSICYRARIVGKWDDYLLSVKPYRFTKGNREELILDPLQCTPLYEYLRNKKLNDKKLPLKVLDISGPTYRNEDTSELVPCIKQLEFHRMEFVYFGSKSDVINIREQILTNAEKICAKLNIPFRRVIGSGCYEVTSNLIKFPESIDTLPVIDLELFIPKGFKKRNKREKYLEVIGGSILGNQQTTRFNIKTKSGKSLWSGCCGFGLNRLMYAFIANNGFNSKKWSALMKKNLED